MKRQRMSIVAAIAAFLMGAGLLPAHVAPAAPGQPVRLVVLGDSLSAGYGLPRSAAFPETLERSLKARGRDVTVTNAGVSGDTTTGGLERLDWSVPDGTDAVILELGANDMLRGVDPAIPRQALDTIVARLKARGIAVMLAGIYASRNLGPDYAQRFDSIYPELAAKHGLVLYPSFLNGVVGVRELNLPDGVHPTARGIEIIVERILPTVERFLTRVKGGGA